ncbi:MAG: T9SS type A sorting domain-containing protein [Saprospiraceae bacterium]|nr:T9SS type A sorting domain-containing protein [Saprospiraceae bacterium]
MYPNPSSGVIHFLLQDTFLPEHIRIFNWSGKLVYSGIYQPSLQIEHLLSGVYVLELTNAKNAYSKVISIVK